MKSNCSSTQTPTGLGRLGFSVLWILFLLWTTGSAFALVTFQSTGSTGFYRDIWGDSQFPVYLNWNLYQCSDSGQESFFDLSANNRISVGGDAGWRFRLFQGYLSVPLGPAVKVQGGRQMFTEGFEMSYLDGGRLRIEATPWLDFKLSGGLLSTPDAPDEDFKTRVLSGGVVIKPKDALMTAGVTQKYLNSDSQTFLYGSAYTDWMSASLRPSLLAKTQWSVDQNEVDQGLVEAAFYPHPQFRTGIEYSSRRPHALDLDRAQTVNLYRYFSRTSTQALANSASWSLISDREPPRIYWRVARLYSDSAIGAENAWQADAGLDLGFSGLVWGPTISVLDSYGGNVFQWGLKLVDSITDSSQLRLTADTAHIQKINGIDGWAYHARGGYSFQLGPRFLALANLELERNHISQIDARMVGYVSHFFY